MKHKNLQKRYNDTNNNLNTQSKDSNRSNHSIKFKVKNN